jgi:hypothetical protein
MKSKNTKKLSIKNKSRTQSSNGPWVQKFSATRDKNKKLKFQVLLYIS